MSEVPQRTSYRLIIEQKEYGWEVVFYGGDGRIRHISHSESEIAALRSAYHMARYYHYEEHVLLRSRYGDKALDLEQLMPSRRPAE